MPDNINTGAHDERTPDNPTKGYKRKVKLAEKLANELLSLLEYDAARVGTLLLLIDLFESNSGDALLEDMLTGSARSVLFGLSVGQGMYDDYIRKLRKAERKGKRKRPR